MVNSQRWSDDNKIIIDRSPGLGIIPYSSWIIPSVLLGAMVHTSIYRFTHPRSFWQPGSGHWGENQDRKIQITRTGTRTRDFQVVIQPFSHWTILAPLYIVWKFEEDLLKINNGIAYFVFSWFWRSIEPSDMCENCTCCRFQITVSSLILIIGLWN